jgi:hypothetical protein
VIQVVLAAEQEMIIQVMGEELQDKEMMEDNIQIPLLLVQEEEALVE